MPTWNIACARTSGLLLTQWRTAHCTTYTQPNPALNLYFNPHPLAPKTHRDAKREYCLREHEQLAVGTVVRSALHHVHALVVLAELQHVGQHRAQQRRKGVPVAVILAELSQLQRCGFQLGGDGIGGEGVT